MSKFKVSARLVPGARSPPGLLFLFLLVLTWPSIVACRWRERQREKGDSGELGESENLFLFFEGL